METAIQLFGDVLFVVDGRRLELTPTQSLWLGLLCVDVCDRRGVRERTAFARRHQNIGSEVVLQQHLKVIYRELGLEGTGQWERLYSLVVEWRDGGKIDYGIWLALSRDLMRFGQGQILLEGLRHLLPEEVTA